MKKTIERNLAEHQEVLAQLHSLENTIQQTAILMVDALKNGKTIFWCGNGGSASDAQHLAGELIGRFKGDRKPLKSISLNADSAVMTCIVNDYGYEHIFSRQVEALGEEGDILVGISTSGQSANVNHALNAAKNKKNAYRRIVRQGVWSSVRDSRPCHRYSIRIHRTYSGDAYHHRPYSV